MISTAWRKSHDSDSVGEFCGCFRFPREVRGKKEGTGLDLLGVNIRCLFVFAQMFQPPSDSQPSPGLEPVQSVGLTPLAACRWLLLTPLAASLASRSNLPEQSGWLLSDLVRLRARRPRSSQAEVSEPSDGFLAEGEFSACRARTSECTRERRGRQD